MKFANVKAVLDHYQVKGYFAEPGRMYIPQNGHFIVLNRNKSKKWEEQTKRVLRPSGDFVKV